MKAVITTVIVTLVAVLGAGWSSDMTVREGIGALGARVGLSIPGSGGADTEASDDAAMIAAAEALDKQFIEAFNAGNAEALAALYWNSPDAVSYPPDTMALQGSEAIKAGIANLTEAMAGARLELTSAHHMVVGDAVVSHGMFKMTLAGPDGQPVEMTGRFTDVKAERDGAWVYLVDHASMPMPAPAPTEEPAS